MRSLLYGGTAVLMLSLGAYAQVAPAIVRTVAATSSGTTTIPNACPRFAPLGEVALAPSVGGNQDIGQLELRKIASLPGSYRLAATVLDGPAPLGTTGFNVVEGVYNANTQVVTYRRSGGTLTTVNLDLPGGEFALSITDDGLICVMDDTTNGLVYWSRRAVDGGIFPAPKVIQGVPTGTHRLGDAKIFTSLEDPATGIPYASARLQLAAVNTLTGSQGNILVGDLTITGTPPNDIMTVSNLRLLMSNPGTFANTNPHSQHPISDAAGNLFGWIVNANLAANNNDDTVYVPYLNGSQGFHRTYRDPNGARQNNGTSLGDSGTWYLAHDQGSSTAFSGDPFEITTVSVNGDTWENTTGGPVRVRVLVPRDTANNWVVQLWLGSSLTPFAITSPPTIGNDLGNFGSPRPPGKLGILPLILLPSLIVPTTNPGGATYAFSVPAVTGSLSMQAIAVNFTTAQIYLSNTATLASR